MKERLSGRRDSLLGRRRERWTRLTFGAMLGLVGGFVAAVVGALILALVAALRLLGLANHPHLETVGSVLLVSIIPLMIFGAHCLDKLEAHSH